jgi:pimeloyl-ACP methyl ester carboxylesterase
MSANGWLAGSVKANGVSLHWTRTGGDLPQVVLAHGFTDDGLCWTPIAEALEGDYDIVMLDARGHGQSEAPERGYGPLVMGEDLAQAIVVLGLERPAVIAHSMGAMATLVAAGTHPDMVRAIVVEDPPSRWLRPLPGGLGRPSEVERLRQEIEVRRQLDRTILVATARAENPRWSDAELVPWADAKLRLRPATAAALDPAEHASTDWRVILHGITCPTLVIGADSEVGSLLSIDGEALIAELVPQARIERIAGAGHSVRRDAPDQYLRLIWDFLASWPPTSS